MIFPKGVFSRRGRSRASLAFASRFAARVYRDRFTHFRAGRFCLSPSPQPDPEAIRALANKWGLLTTAPEPLDLWRQEIRFFRSLTLPKLADKLSTTRFRLVPVEENGAVVLRYRATRFLDAIHQRFAEEFSGLIECARCPAPNCGRWFLKSAGRGDRRFCSHPCKMRAFRRGGVGT